MEHLAENIGLDNRESVEVVNPFPLARELFDLARKELDETSFQRYVDPAQKDVGQRAVKLPDKFAGLMEGFPGKYFLVSFEDRLSDYYAEGTRSVDVRLSSAEHRYESDARLHEVRIREYDRSEGRGNVIFLTISDFVNENSLLGLNSQRGDETSSPHGSAENTYEVDSSGRRTLKESHFVRLDEALCQWKNENQPVRWVRNLDVENSGQGGKIIYKDIYLIGRDEKGDSTEQAQVKTEVQMKQNEVESVVVEIGIGSRQSARILFQNVNPDIKIWEHSPVGMRVFADQMEIIKKDPNYAFIFKQPVRLEEVMSFIKGRVSMLRNDWDKNGTVFGSNQVEGSVAA